MASRLKASDYTRIAFFSVLFGLARMVFFALQESNHSLAYELLLLLCSSAVCAFCTIFFSLLSRHADMSCSKSDYSAQQSGKGLLSYSRKQFFALFLTVNTVALLTWFPGTTYYDTLLIYFNRMTMMTQFPPIYCLWVTVLADLGRAVHYPRLTMIVLSITQILVVSAMMAQISRWICEKHLPVWFKFAAVLFCILNPLYSMYAIAAIKDTLASLALVVMMTVLYDMTIEAKEHEKGNWFILGGCMVFPLAFRSNGFFIILILLLVMLFCFRHYRRRVLFLFLEMMIIRAIEKILLWRFSVTPFIQEALAIPLQQLCAAVAWNGHLSADQSSFINALLPLDVIREVYNPFIVDPIKWNSEFGGGFLENNLSGFFQTWLGVLPNNLRIYSKAYLLQTLGYWAPANLGTTEIFTEIGGLHSDYLIANQLVSAPLWGKGSLQAVLEKYYRSAANFPSEGVWIWLMFYCCFFRELIKNDRKSLFLFSPCLLCWLSLMLAAPVYTGTRYALSAFYGIPVFLALAIL